MMYKFGFALAVPSLGLIDRYLGMAAVPFYIVGVLCVMGMIRRYENCLLGLFTERQARGVLVAIWVTICACFIVIYPIANSGRLGGGSDRDEALNVAVTELLAGRYPYYAQTYLNNPISPMPGALVLATPFVLLGNSAYQTVVWIGLFMGAMWRISGDARRTVLLMGVMLGTCPAIMYEVVTGSDLFTNSVYILLFTLFLVWSQSRAMGWKLAAAVLLGVSLASRANFLLLIPPLFILLWQQAGWRSAIFQISCTIFVTGSLIGGFYAYDPAGFSPLHTASELAMFNAVVPFATLWIPLGTLLLALGLMWYGGGLGRYLHHATIILAFPILCGLAIMVGVWRFHLMFSLFGVVYVCWYVMAIASLPIKK